MRSFQTQKARWGVRTALPTAFVCLALLPGCARLAPLIPGTLRPGSVNGQVLAGPDAADGESWAVVYLAEPQPTPAPTAPVARLSRLAGGFSPALLAVAPGQPVDLASRDGIHHRFFSYSEPNHFDSGPVRSGEAARVSFAHPGLVQVYCSLHPEERATVFVAPSPWFAAVRAPGPYAIRDVPPGSYALHAWSEAREPTRRPVTVRGGQTTSVEIGLGRPEPQP